MACAVIRIHWRVFIGTGVSRVTKSRILEAVREGAGAQAVELIAHLKKGDMAREAERLLDGSCWLPEPLRLDDPDSGQAAVADDISVELPAFLADDDDAQPDDEEERQHLIAAE